MRSFIPALLIATITMAPPAAADELDASTRRSVDAGLTWLAARWDPAAEVPVFGERPKDRNPLAVTALVGIALLAATDDKPGEGKYGPATKDCLDTVLAAQREDG